MEAICLRTTATSKWFPFKKSTKVHGLKRRRIPKMDRKMTKDSDQDSSEREKKEDQNGPNKWKDVQLHSEEM